MNASSHNTKRVANFQAAVAVGDFYFDADFKAIFIVIPDEQGGPDLRHIPIDRAGPSPGKWGWNGNEEKPTLTPSIFTYDGHNNPVWHGFLTDGFLKSC